MLKQTFICPFCFEKGRLSDLQFRCVNRRCEDVDDIPLTKYENGDIRIPKKGKTCFKVVMKAGVFPDSGECPRCHHKSHKLVCPACHNALPESTILGTDMIISIVGARDTGKSHFIGVIINELINRVASSFDGAIEGFDDTMQRYTAGPYKKLFVDLQKLPLTKSSEQDVNNGAYRPYIFTLKLKEKAKLGNKDNIKSYTLVFFDTAGEDLDDADVMSTVNKYICKSSGIIFLLDPMQIPAVRNQLDEDVVSRASSVGWQQATRSDEIMTRVSKLIRDDRHMKSEQKIDIPVAVVFSKFDAISSLVPEGSTILETSPHCAKKFFDLTDCHNVDSEIRSLLTEWGEEAFMSQVSVNYSNYSYFSVSALGLNNNPTADQKIERPRPHRIEDPLLWVLKENGVIKTNKK